MSYLAYISGYQADNALNSFQLFISSIRSSCHLNKIYSMKCWKVSKEEIFKSGMCPIIGEKSGKKHAKIRFIQILKLKVFFLQFGMYSNFSGFSFLVLGLEYEYIKKYRAREAKLCRISLCNFIKKYDKLSLIWFELKYQQEMET